MNKIILEFDGYEQKVEARQAMDAPKAFGVLEEISREHRAFYKSDYDSSSKEVQIFDQKISLEGKDSTDIIEDVLMAVSDYITENINLYY